MQNNPIQSDPKRRVTLLNLSIIESLLKLMHSKDAIIRKNAIACVAACTEISTHSYLLFFSNSQALERASGFQKLLD